MKFFLLIALVAIVAVILISMQRSNARVTTIEQRREKRADHDEEDA